MASYQILSWAEIPVGVKAKDDSGTVREELPIRFQHAVDAVATATDRIETKAYLAEWNWGEAEDRPGTASEVATRVVAELVAAYPSERMKTMKADLIARLSAHLSDNLS
jgi:hypothetical protein